MALLISVQALAQQDCELTLTNATKEFQDGHFYTIPSILGGCLTSFSNDQKLRAYLLLTQTYLLLDDPIGAKVSYLGVLKANPEFIADENIHSTDVVYLSKRFTASPIFAFFAKAGTNVSPVKVIQDNNAFGDARVTEGYKLTIGYHVDAGGDFYLSEHVGIRAELNYSFNRYQLNSQNYFERDTKSFDERQTWISLPVTILYTKAIGKYRPYGYLGYSPAFLSRDVATIRITNYNASEEGETIAEGEQVDKKSPDINIVNKRNRINQSILLGGGVKMKFGLRFFFLDVRYAIGLKNIVDKKNLYADYSISPLTSDEFIQSFNPVGSYAHVDDFFRINNLSVSVGVLQPLYKPRELKRARTRGVLKRINNQAEEGNEN